METIDQIATRILNGSNDPPNKEKLYHFATLNFILGNIFGFGLPYYGIMKMTIKII